MTACFDMTDYYMGGMTMSAQRIARWNLPTLAAALTAISGSAYAAALKVNLSGEQEGPLVTTVATGSSTIMVGADKCISGSITTKGIEGVAAHIHDAPAGKNGGVAVPLTKGADGSWSVAAGA